MASDSQVEESEILTKDVGKKPAAGQFKFKKIWKSGASQNQDFDDASGRESSHVGKSLRRGNKSESSQEMFGLKHQPIHFFELPISKPFQPLFMIITKTLHSRSC